MASSESISMRALFKFILPLMGLLGTSVLLWGDEHKVWSVFPFLLIVLYVSAAEIRMDGKQVYYRRFISWRKLPDDVSDVRCSLFPALGYIKFRHFLSPFGVLFFIAERGYGRFIPFRRTAFMLAMLSPSNPQQSKNDNETEKAEDDQTRKSGLLRVLVLIAGMIVGILIPVPWQHMVTPANNGLLSRFLDVQQHPAVLSFYVGLLILLIIWNKFHNFVNFGLAFIVGSILAHLGHLR